MVLSVAYLVAVAFLGWGLSLFSSEKMLRFRLWAFAVRRASAATRLQRGLESFKVFDD